MSGIGAAHPVIHDVDELGQIPAPEKPLRVLITAFKSLPNNTRVVRQAKALQARGHEVTVFALHHPSQKLMDESPGVRFMETQYCYLYAPECIKNLSNKYALVGKLWHSTFSELVGHRMLFAVRAWRTFRQEKFDAIVVHDHHSMYAALAAGAFKKTTYILDSVEVPYFKPVPTDRRLHSVLLRHIERRMERFCLRACHYVMTVSHALAAWLISNRYAREAYVVRNCRVYEDIKPLCDIRTHCGLPEGKLLALYLNTVYAGQGLEQLIDALPAIHSNVHLAILGLFDPPALKDELEQRIDALGLRNRVTILPVIPIADLLPYIAGADFGIIPRQKLTINNRVSLPNRVLEMIAARLPLAVCSIEDIARIVLNNEIGTVFNETDTASITREVNRLIEPAMLAQCRKNVIAASKRLDWNREGAYFSYIIEQMAARQCPC